APAPTAPPRRSPAYPGVAPSPSARPGRGLRRDRSRADRLRAGARGRGSWAEVEHHAAVAKRARQIGRRSGEAGLLDGELQRLVEEAVAGFLLELVLED